MGLPSDIFPPPSLLRGRKTAETAAEKDTFLQPSDLYFLQTKQLAYVGILKGTDYRSRLRSSYRR